MHVVMQCYNHTLMAYFLINITPFIRKTSIQLIVSKIKEFVMKINDVYVIVVLIAAQHSLYQKCP